MRSLTSVILGIAVSLLIVALLGASPLEVANVLLHSSFGSVNQFLGTLSYATPLIFTGLSVSVAFYAGLFNIGGEGQLYIGALVMTAAALCFPNMSSFAGKSTMILLAALGGGFWGFIAGYLKSKRGSHEVIVTIMLNFIAYAICGYFIMNFLKNPLSQNPESAEIPALYHVKSLTPSTTLNYSFLLAILMIFLVWFVLFRTVWGQEVRFVGAQVEAAKRSGVRVSSRLIQAMTFSGMLAGLVAVHEILGNTHKFKDQFSPGYGFIGIAVALLAKNKPFVILPSALLFGALAKGSLDLELDTEKVTRDMAMMIQGLIILFLSAQGIWDSIKWRRKC